MMFGRTREEFGSLLISTFSSLTTCEEGVDNGIPKEGGVVENEGGMGD